MKNEAADASITFEEIVMAMICGEKPYLGPLRKQMKREPKRLLVPMVEKAKSSQSFDYAFVISLYYFL